MAEFVKGRLHDGTEVVVPSELASVGDKGAMRAYVVESGQATWQQVIPPSEGPVARPDDPGALGNVMVQAGRQVTDLGRSATQLISDQETTDAIQGDRVEARRLNADLASDRPVSSFAGNALPSFAVPGGMVAQVGAGIAEGALSADPGNRLQGAAIGGTVGAAGQRLGDIAGQAVQRASQTATGNPNAAARQALSDANVPLSLSQRTDDHSIVGAISKPLAEFFERGRFVLTGTQPKAAAQQKRATELVTDALGIQGNKLTRETLGKAVESNRAVFSNAAKDLGGKVFPDDQLISEASRISDEFARVGSDSPQIEKIFNEFLNAASSPNGIDADKYLKIRSNLSQATTKSDIETSAIVDAIGAMDDQVARSVPHLADELATARDRFRLILALRRGSSLSPSGDINVNTFTNNLERIFKDFEVNAPLPGDLAPVGEAIAGLNQVARPFRSSGTAENLLAAGGIPIGAATDPSLLARVLSGAAAPFAGGGAGAQLGGGASRGLLEAFRERSEGKKNVGPRKGLLSPQL